MGRIDHALIEALDRWHRPWGWRRGCAVAVVVLLIAASTWLVYATGGIKYVYAHSVYLPILLAAGFFGPVGGVAAGVAGGLALGPWMPIDTATGEAQDLVNWLYRTGFFVLVGGMAGGMGATVIHLAGRDSLSGAPNRLPLRHAVNARAERQAAGAASPFSLVVAICDNYREIANTFGPEMGAQLMRALVARLSRVVGSGATVYHLHGEHFAMIVPTAEVPALHQSILARVRDPIDLEAVPVYVNLSLGRADCPDHGTSSEALVQRATVAAEIAVRRGNIDTAYDTRFDHSNRENLLLLGQLGGAISGDQLRLHYQPKLHLPSGVVRGVEALVRWEHPEWGLLPPGRFVPQAEKTHLIRLLTPWVVESALRDQRYFVERGFDYEVAVNLSARNLHDPLLISTIRRLLDESKVDPGRLELEVTESAIMSDPAAARRVLAEAREYGMRIAIDDFGTGQTTLTYLRDLTATTLKIDRAFVCNLAVDDKDRYIVRAIIRLAHDLGMEVVAEGVEEWETVEVLRDMECDVVQGYVVSRPCPAEELTASS